MFNIVCQFILLVIILFTHDGFRFPVPELTSNKSKSIFNESVLEITKNHLFAWKFCLPEV